MRMSISSSSSSWRNFLVPIINTDVSALTIAEDYYVIEIKKRLQAIEGKIGKQLFDTLEIEYIEVLFQHGHILDQTLFQRFQYIKDNLERQQSIGLYNDKKMYTNDLAKLEYFLRAVNKWASNQELDIVIAPQDHAKQLFHAGVIWFLEDRFTQRPKDEIASHISAYKPIKHPVYWLKKLWYLKNEQELDEWIKLAMEDFASKLTDDILLFPQMQHPYEYYQTKRYDFTRKGCYDVLDSVQIITQWTWLTQEQVCNALKVLCEDAFSYLPTDPILAGKWVYHHLTGLSSLLLKYDIHVQLPLKELDILSVRRSVQLDPLLWNDKEAVSAYILQQMIIILTNPENIWQLELDIFLRPLDKLAAHLQIDRNIYYKQIFSRINQLLLTMIAQDNTQHKRVLLEVYNSLFAFLEPGAMEYTIDLGIQKDEVFYKAQCRAAFLIQLPLREEQVEKLDIDVLATFEQTNDLYSQSLFLLYDYKQLISRDQSIAQVVQERLQKARQSLVSHIARQRLQQNNLRLQRSLYSDIKSLLAEETTDLTTTITSYYKDKIPELIKYDMQQIGIWWLQWDHSWAILLPEDIIYMQEVVTQWLTEWADSIKNS
jgi:hypothetical protein